MVGGDAGDDGPEVTDVALQDLEVRICGAVGVGLVGQDGDVQTQPGGGGQEALGDGVGGVEGEQVQAHGVVHGFR